MGCRFGIPVPETHVILSKIRGDVGIPRINQPLELPVEVRFASLWWNNECNFEPHYYVQECAKDTEGIWIHFPWEHWWNAPV